MSTMSGIAPDRILVRMPNWIGDAVMCLPALMDLREYFSNAHITLVAKPTIADVLRGQCGINEVIVYDHQGEHCGVLGLVRLSRLIHKQAFDMAILFQNAFEAAVLARLAHIPIRIGYATDGRGCLLSQSVPLPQQPALHQIRYYQYLVQTITQNPSRDHVPHLSVSPNDPLALQAKFSEVRSSSTNVLIGLNPGSVYGSAKRWMPERFAELGDKLVQEIQQQHPELSSVRCVIIGGKGEEALGVEMANQMVTDPIVLTGKTSIAEVLSVLHHCAVLVSNDTGPMHLAHALGVPVVAIFGSTNPETTGLVGGEHSVIREPVRCSPCLLRSCPIDHRCMTQISADQILKVVMERMDHFLVAQLNREHVG